MSKKNKKNKDEELEIDYSDSQDDSYDLDDEDFPKSAKELKAEAKAKAKQEKKEDLEQTDEILNSKSKTKAGQTFKMYKFIIKIVVFAVLVAFGVVLWVEQAIMVGAVYLVSGIGITFAAIIRMIPLLKTSSSKRARFILLIQCLIHLVLGVYLILAAFIHWNVLNALMDEGIKKKELLDNLNKVSGGTFASFNLVFYIYLMVIFFFTLSAGYFWVTIRYNEKTSKTLFWLMMISNTLAVVLGLIAKYLDARTLIITLIVLIFLGAVVVAGEAGGGYYRYRKALTAPKKKDKKAEAGDSKKAPARNDNVDYSDIDPTTIPVEDPQDDAIVS